MAKQDTASAFLQAIRGGVPAQAPRPRRNTGQAARTRVTLPLDADILEYFEGTDRDALARIHRVLRAHVDAKRG
jgi:uncharacterized protein (DUF4415 family)